MYANDDNYIMYSAASAHSETQDANRCYRAAMAAKTKTFCELRLSLWMLVLN